MWTGFFMSCCPHNRQPKTRNPQHFFHHFRHFTQKMTKITMPA